MIPEGIVATEWPSVRATCERCQIPFDNWQDGAGRVALGKNSLGLWACDAVVWSIARQVGKTHLVGGIVLALLLKNSRTLALWTAHRYPTAEDTFNDIKAMIERSPELRRHVRKIYDSAGKQRIIFRNGSRLLFGARERGFGRGFKKVGILVFDEAQILTNNAVDDMVPATNRHPNPLIFYIGTPPKPSDASDHFAMMRREAINGESTDVFYVEIGADPDADPRDREQWAKGNPSYPRHTTARAMLRMLKNLGIESFLREGLGIWDPEAVKGVFSQGAWARRRTEIEPGPPAAVAIASDVDQVWLSLAAASLDEIPHLGSVVRMRSKDRAKFITEVARIQLEYGVPVAIDAKGPASVLIDDLEEAGVDLILTGLDDLVQACADLVQAVEDGDVVHGDYTELNRAVDAVGWRKVGDRRVFARRAGDISSLEAAALALWLSKTEPVYDIEDSIY